MENFLITWIYSPLLSGDSTLKQRLHERQRHAEERYLALRHANDFLDDDGIIEGIFSSLTGLLLPVY